MNFRRFLFSVRWYLVTSIMLFLFSTLTAFFFPSWFTFFDSYLSRLFTEALHLTGVKLFWFIFYNNLLASFIGMMGGILFGILPFGICVMNGCALGYVAALVRANEGIAVLWRLLPHGIFELPALFLALALGLRLGVASTEVILGVVHGRKLTDFWFVLRSSLVTFLCIVVPLLLVAGIIESWFITLGV